MYFKPDLTTDHPITDPHFVGSFAFLEFGHAAMHGHGPASYQIELLQTQRRPVGSG